MSVVTSGPAESPAVAWRAENWNTMAPMGAFSRQLVATAAAAMIRHNDVARTESPRGSPRDCRAIYCEPAVSPNVPFALRRPWLITRDLFHNRARPDVEALQGVADPESFVWRILPHAARTFAACITLLPAESARAAAVAYLYCRILDTYEDLIPPPAEREEALADFGRRFRVSDGAPMQAAVRLDASRAHDPRDRTHVVLVNRCHLVDEVFRTLSPVARRDIAELVESMAVGMIWSSRTFGDQGGALRDAGQLSRYCRNVIGLPFFFAVRLLQQQRTGEPSISDALREDCLLAGEMVQLANITRDIEKDLRPGRRLSSCPPGGPRPVGRQ